MFAQIPKLTGNLLTVHVDPREQNTFRKNGFAIFSEAVVLGSTGNLMAPGGMSTITVSVWAVTASTWAVAATMCAVSASMCSVTSSVSEVTSSMHDVQATCGLLHPLAGLLQAPYGLL